jgi:hypothetical protein
MIRKGQAHQIGGRDLRAQTNFVAELSSSRLTGRCTRPAAPQTQTSQHNPFGAYADDLAHTAGLGLDQVEHRHPEGHPIRPHWGDNETSRLSTTANCYPGRRTCQSGGRT